MVVKVPVILHLSDDPAIETDLEFCFAIVWFIAGMYFKGVWSKFMINEWGILYFSTIMTMLWRYNNSASFLAPFAISTLPVVHIRFLKPVLRNKLFPQCEGSRLIWLKSYWGFGAIKVFAADIATAGGIEIWFDVTVSMPGTVINQLLTERYKQLAERL